MKYWNSPYLSAKICCLETLSPQAYHWLGPFPKTLPKSNFHRPNCLGHTTWLCIIHFSLKVIFFFINWDKIDIYHYISCIWFNICIFYQKVFFLFFFLLAQALFYMKHDILAKMIYSIDVKKCCILKSNLVTNMEKIPSII